MPVYPSPKASTAKGLLSVIAEGTRVFIFRPAISVCTSGSIRAEGVFAKGVRTMFAGSVLLEVGGSGRLEVGLLKVRLFKVRLLEVRLFDVCAEGVFHRSRIAEGLLSPKAFRLTISAAFDAHNSVMLYPFQEFLVSLERASRALSNKPLIESRRHTLKTL